MRRAGRILVGGWITAALIATCYLVLTAVAVRLATGSRPAACGCFGAADGVVGGAHVVLDLAALGAAVAGCVRPPGAVWTLFDGGPLTGLTVIIQAVLLAALGYVSITALPALTAARRQAEGNYMTVLVLLETIVLVVLTVLVAGLLRAYATVLKRLHALDGGGSAARPFSLDAPAAVAAPLSRDEWTAGHDLAGETVRGELVSTRVVGVEHDTVLLFLSSGCASCEVFWDELARPVTLPAGTRLVIVDPERRRREPRRDRRPRVARARRADVDAGLARLRGAGLAARGLRRGSERADPRRGHRPIVGPGRAAAG